VGVFFRGLENAGEICSRRGFDAINGVVRDRAPALRYNRGAVVIRGL